MTESDEYETPPDPSNNQIARRDFGGMQIAHQRQPTAALVARARAEIEARFSMAMMRPRNMDQVRTLLMKECRRPSFAAVAVYEVPRGGKKITGLSIRFAEVAVRCMGNVAIDQSVIDDDTEQRLIRVSVTDLESNVTWPADVVVTKTVERKTLRKGQRPSGTRVNSAGEQVFIVEADEGDLVMKQAAMISKQVRTLILRLIPGHLQDEARKICDEVYLAESKQDPDAERNRMIDAFAAQSILPIELERWLGHPLATATPAEVSRLRRVWSALEEGETTWEQAVSVEDAARKAAAAPQPPAATQAAPTPTAEPTKPQAPAQAPQPAASAPSSAPKEAAPPPAARGRGAAALKEQIRKPPAPAAAEAPPPVDPAVEYARATAAALTTPPPEGFEERACAGGCGAVIDVEIGTPTDPGAKCYACTQK